MRWRSPLLLHYYITEKCNCQCQFCDIWPQKSQGFAVQQEVLANLQSAARLGVKFVDFTGGEPLLHPDLPALLSQAKKLNLRTTLTTNALLYPDLARELAGRIDFLHFSLDASTAEEHNQLRGASAFDQVMTSLDLARALGEKPDILFTATQDNLHHLPVLAELARRTGLILIVNPVFSHLKKRELDTHHLSFIEQFRNKPFVYINMALHALHREGGNRPENPRCRVMDSVIVVSPNNELVAPCYHFPQQHFPIQTNLEQLWKSPALRSHRARQGRWEACLGCTLNCYFDPGFMYSLDRFFIMSIAAKLKYSADKYMRHRWLVTRSQIDLRPVRIILDELLREHPVELIHAGQ